MSNAYTYLDGYYKTSYYTIQPCKRFALSLSTLRRRFFYETCAVDFSFNNRRRRRRRRRGGELLDCQKGFRRFFSKCTKMMAGRPGPVWLCPATRKVFTLM